MHGPKDKKYDKEMMHVPKLLKFGTSKLFNRCGSHQHQASKHYIPRPARAGSEISSKKPFETLLVLGGKLGKIVPMCERMDPGKEDNRPSHKLMEGDVFIKLYDAVQRSLPRQRYECATDWKDEDGNVKVKDQCSSSGNGVCCPERRTCLVHVIFQMVVNEAKGKYHTV